jgi:molybdopterin/thiamine biosynthesis adenylyltransferase
LKFLIGVGTLLKGKLLLVDGEFMRFSTVSFKRVRSCPDCGHVHGNALG